VWDANAPSIHDSSILAIRSDAGVVHLDVQLDEEQGWALLHLSFVLVGEKAPSWFDLKGLLDAGAEPELMRLRLEPGRVHLGVSIEPAWNGVRWLDISERVNEVRYSVENPQAE
jgi:hypothetical protein